MAILIGNQENVFSVKGEINKTSSMVLKEYIESQFKKCSQVVMNIDQVQKIDQNGFNVLSIIYYTSLEQGKVFRITGEGCKDIYDDFLMSA